MVDLPPLFTYSGALAAGLTESAIRHQVRQGRLIVVRHGVYCSRDVWERMGADQRLRHELEIRAVLMSLGGAWVSHYSGAALQQLPLPSGWDEVVTLTRPVRAAGRPSYPGVRFRTAAVPPAHRTTVFGLPVLTVARNVLDIARTDGVAAGLVVGDAALRRDLATPAQLAATVADLAGWPGVSAARLVAEHASGLRESPVESVSYAVFVRRGLALPECNAWLSAERRGGVRADFAWRRHRLLGEADGRVKYDDPWSTAETVLWKEKLRQERLEDLGFVVTRWTGAEIHRDPDAVVARLAERSRRAHEMYGVPMLVR
ncbi:type IV toxin-antitoxin system AbiEi family antitoxin domain-containing protein [Jiangella alkaliphila]|uniref:Transcriptional regulator, AbiEi antitoxin, Type IV TA system n=1 Tax=Jiangella alkaliphila TaxID=419479 RepID=A0A1H2L118_9ACTN|nr:type IV toxin-antitoxin system AbiEi family antitoxin domain-containing protein [Jiangella alkaliphila]SDU74492.1 Transcriptional regulator, AbiEi antitoxin, Type IV TA system [Jiangella alkaliphila]